MCRLTDRMVRSTLVTAWFFADWPTSTSPLRANATTEGVVRAPSELAMTVGSPPSRTATTELVVPRSMPTARAMVCASDVGSLSCLHSSLPWAGSRHSRRLESATLNLLDVSNAPADDRVPAAREGPTAALQGRGGAGLDAAVRDGRQ